MKDFNQKDWVFLILSIVAIVAGVASFSYGHIVLLICILALGMIWGYFTIVHFRHKGYPFTIIKSRVCIDFADKEGKLANFWKEHIIRPNQPNRKDYDEYICQDGKVTNINASIVGVKSHYINEDVDSEGYSRKYEVKVRHVFDNELEKGREYRRIFSYDVIDSYTHSKEKYHLHVDRPIKNVLIELRFPREREIKTIRVCRACIKKGEIVLPSEPTIIHGDKTIFFHEFIKPDLGRYFIEWTW